MTKQSVETSYKTFLLHDEVPMFYTLRWKQTHSLRFQQNHVEEENAPFNLLDEDVEDFIIWRTFVN